MRTRALDRRLAKQVPEGTFNSPLEIVDERLFTRGEKLATLNRWRQTALRTSVYVESRRVLELIDEAKSRLGVHGIAAGCASAQLNDRDVIGSSPDQQDEGTSCAQFAPSPMRE